MLYINKLSLKHTASNNIIESENSLSYPITLNNIIYDLFIIPKEFINKDYNYTISTDYSLHNSKEIIVYIFNICLYLYIYISLNGVIVFILYHIVIINM